MNDGFKGLIIVSNSDSNDKIDAVLDRTMYSCTEMFSNMTTKNGLFFVFVLVQHVNVDHHKR